MFQIISQVDNQTKIIINGGVILLTILSTFAAATSLLPTASSLLAPLNATPVVGTALCLAALGTFVGKISKGINIVLNVSF
jgi:ABC-type polysaccharide/polyol phosphate export permease